MWIIVFCLKKPILFKRFNPCIFDTQTMSLSDFVEQKLFTTLQEVRSQGLTDEVLSIYEIALIYYYTETGYEHVNELLIQNKGITTTDYDNHLATTL